MPKYPETGVSRVTLHLSREVKRAEARTIQDGLKKKLPWIEYMKFDKQDRKPVLYVDHMRNELMGHSEDTAYRWIRKSIDEVAPGLLS